MTKGMRILRRLTIFILDYWWVLCLGMLLTAWLVNVEYGLRGYFAFGGEWLVVPAGIGARRFAIFLMEGNRGAYGSDNGIYGRERRRA